MKNDLQELLFDFVVRVFKFLRTFPKNQEYSVIRYQLLKSASSTGANYEEAQAGSSRADFTYKVEISLKEMRETNYWLRLIKATSDRENINTTELENLIAESKELKLILGSIVTKTKK